MRLVSPADLGPGPRPQTRHCEAAGCIQATREGKAYCPDHVDHHPYVQDLSARIAEREAQDERVFKRGPKAVAAKSITVQEIIQHLDHHGPRTEERLCRELNLDLKTLQGYVGALVKARIVSLGQTKRGSTLVKLVKRRSTAQPSAPAETKKTKRVG